MTWAIQSQGPSHPDPASLRFSALRLPEPSVEPSGQRESPHSTVISHSLSSLSPNLAPPGLPLPSYRKPASASSTLSPGLPPKSRGTDPPPRHAAQRFRSLARNELTRCDENAIGSTDLSSGNFPPSCRLARLSLCVYRIHSPAIEPHVDLTKPARNPDEPNSPHLPRQSSSKTSSGLCGGIRDTIFRKPRHFTCT